MKSLPFAGLLALPLFCLLCLRSDARYQQAGYVLQHSDETGREEAGPHAGGGKTTVYPFFSQVRDFKMAFRKRVLHPGSAIGYHLQQTDEVYYILSGQGEMNMNGQILRLKAGDALLTRAGSSHGLRPVGRDDLSLIITYDLP
ncbi:MAG TPA: cupin domain-containing protein [Chitinophagaceae bacterium]|nr:cupin domain-containing protein [Chitinophagaceae bacterium]